jgi:hypothetical protein
MFADNTRSSSLRGDFAQRHPMPNAEESARQVGSRRGGEDAGQQIDTEGGHNCDCQSRGANRAHQWDVK